MVKLFRNLRRRARSLVGKTKWTARAAKQPLDHDRMRLPQELIDHILHMLQDDILTLKACSLTCKAMFASTRHLIHQTLRLTFRNNQSVLTREDKVRHLRRNNHGTQLRFLSHLGERGLLQYPQKLHIDMYCTFIPETLSPHLAYFQSLDRIHSLTIEQYDIISWANHYKTCFLHFYPTLTSLTLHRPFYHYRLLLQFALQFPNLENLSLEWLTPEEQPRADLPLPALIDQSPPLRGHLRMAGVHTVVQWPVDFAHELPNGINFRSVELEGFFGSTVHPALNGCAHSLESLTIVLFETGYLQMHNLKLSQPLVLRRLALRMMFCQLSRFSLELIPRVIKTISSPVFCEFVLELSALPSPFDGPSSVYWGGWGRIDRFLDNQFANRKDFRFIVRTDKLCDRETFERHAKKTFSFLENRGCIHFETCP